MSLTSAKLPMTVTKLLAYRRKYENGLLREI